MLPALPVAERSNPSPAEIFLSRFTSPASARAMSASVQLLARMILGLRVRVALGAVPWAKLARADVTALRARLVARYAPATTNRHLSALRGVLRECWRAGALSQEGLAHLLDAARDVPGASLRAAARAALSPDEIEALFRACARDRSATGARDAALLALLFGCGLRRSSAVAVQLEDYDRTTGRLVVPAKGGKVGALYLPAGARRAVDDWLAVRGTDAGPLVTAVHKGGRVLLRQLNPEQVRRVCERRAQDARLERPFRPHDARRAVAGQAIDASDLASAQALLMHSSPNVTARYDLRGERRLRVVAERLHVPHFPRARAIASEVASSPARSPATRKDPVPCPTLTA